jgi:hypothetical protein
LPLFERRLQALLSILQLPCRLLLSLDGCSCLILVSSCHLLLQRKNRCRLILMSLKGNSGVSLLLLRQIVLVLESISCAS